MCSTVEAMAKLTAVFLHCKLPRKNFLTRKYDLFT